MHKKELQEFIEANLETSPEKLLEIAGHELVQKHMKDLLNEGACFCLSEESPEEEKKHNKNVIVSWINSNKEKIQNLICKNDELKSIFKKRENKYTMCFATAEIIGKFYPDLTAQALGAITMYFLYGGYQIYCADYIK